MARSKATLWTWLGCPGLLGCFLLGFLAGWFTKPTEKTPSSSDVYQNVRQKLVAEMKAENIKQFLRSFTKLPHLAGTERNLLLAKQIQGQWKEFGLDSAELVHYDVLLSYPNEKQPNYISVIDDQGNEIFNTSLFEPPPQGYENITDILPPYNAFSAQGVPEADLVYVNYGRTEDFFKLEREMGINCTGKIVIARYGKIFRGNKVKNAILAGAQGIILYSDPADYCAPGVDAYPDGWNLPGGGAQRGNVLNLNGAGDPLTPGYPAKEYTFRYKVNEGVGIPKIPVHPIGYHDAEVLLRKVRMHVHTNNKITRIYNVIGILRGAVEPGWRPKRTIIFASWDAEEFGLLGSTEWAEVASCKDNQRLIQKADKFSNYPVYHTVYETFELVEKFYDPTFKKQLTIAQLRGKLVYELADSQVIPFDCRDYGEALKGYSNSIYKLAKKHEEQLKTYKVSFVAVRIMNDQLMFVERAFIDPLGLPGRKFYRTDYKRTGDGGHVQWVFSPGQADIVSGKQNVQPFNRKMLTL
ncbi:n-acetylated-alpha-linked acidic dipeptidase 2-like [Limosa lapponica baueri]|uniref:N-acetylated-alpha-linked acidic dipeptidase 2-like n=1 Tax=Limosa lapponica baueri TaxID=1758121 RepID=A0A2I0TMC8_LIMLA|nr:n-acetylated-alpha-linked acidic dipeptidase 2-like [Limosa lapponica baueri]